MKCKKALSVIRQLGVWGLDDSDGCECCRFSLFGVNVDVSCRKSEQTIRAHTRNMDSYPSELEEVAKEVASQLSQNYKIRYCMTFWTCLLCGAENFQCAQACAVCGAKRTDEKAIAAFCYKQVETAFKACGKARG